MLKHSSCLVLSLGSVSHCVYLAASCFASSMESCCDSINHLLVSYHATKLNDVCSNCTAAVYQQIAQLCAFACLCCACCPPFLACCWLQGTYSAAAASASLTCMQCTHVHPYSATVLWLILLRPLLSGHLCSMHPATHQQPLFSIYLYAASTPSTIFPLVRIPVWSFSTCNQNTCQNCPP